MSKASKRSFCCCPLRGAGLAVRLLNAPLSRRAQARKIAAERADLPRKGGGEARNYNPP